MVLIYFQYFIKFKLWAKIKQGTTAARCPVKGTFDLQRRTIQYSLLSVVWIDAINRNNVINNHNSCIKEDMSVINALVSSGGARGSKLKGF